MLHKKINWVLLLKFSVIFITAFIVSAWILNILYTFGLIQWSWLDRSAPMIKKFWPIGLYLIFFSNIGCLILLHIKHRSPAWGLFIGLGVLGLLTLSILSLTLKRRTTEVPTRIKKSWVRLIILSFLYIVIIGMLILPFIERTQLVQEWLQKITMQIYYKNLPTNKDEFNDQTIVSSSTDNKHNDVLRWTNIHPEKFEYHGDGTPPSWMYDEKLINAKEGEFMVAFFNFIPRILSNLGKGKVDSLMTDTEKQLISDVGSDVVKERYKQSVNYFSGYKDGLMERQDWFPYRTEKGANGISVYGNFKLPNGDLHRYFLLLVMENDKPVMAGFIPTLSYEEIHGEGLVGITNVIVQ